MLPHLVPAMLERHVEAVLLGIGGFSLVAGLLEELLELLVPHVTQPFVEQQPENILFVVPGIDGASQDVGCLPKMPFEFRLRKFRH